jgi:uncharacterized protein YggU (UPF0235/DUF167 family)
MTARIQVRVHPGARHTRIVGRGADGTWRLEVRAAPEGGRANAAVVRLVAEALRLPRAAVRVMAGQSSRSKRLEIDELEVADVESRLARAVEGES